MKSFFKSKKIAVVGASRDRDKVGNVIYRNLLRSRRKIFAVNSKADKVEGNKAYNDVLSIPFSVDLAIIVVPAKAVPGVLKECGEKDIERAIIVSAGFEEAGNEERGRKVETISKKYDMEIIGPNVLGIINPYQNINASFFRDMPKKGNVAFISQSGAVGTSLLDRALETGTGISGFVSLGNMQDQDFIDALEYFGSDIRTEVIVMYIESLRKETGRKFVDLCRNISKDKKIVAIKAGKSEVGEKAEATHTASLSSPAEIYAGAFKQAGIDEVESLDELFNVARIYSKYGQLGKNAGIITNAGGLGVLASDAFSKNDIDVSSLSGEVLNQLDQKMPEGYSRNNPLDILGDALAERYGKALKILEMYDIYDFYTVIVSPQEMTQPLKTAKLLANKGKPVFPCFVGGQSFKKAKEFLTEEGVIYFEDVAEAGRVLGKAIRS